MRHGFDVLAPVKCYRRSMRSLFAPGGDKDKVQILEVVKGLPPYEELEKKIDAPLASE